jgi:hypothetical protein
MFVTATTTFIPQNDLSAGVLMTKFIVENNLPIALADKCGPCSEICSHIRKL